MSNKEAAKSPKSSKTPGGNNPPAENKASGGNGSFIAKLGLTLLAITAAVALLLSGVNALTADKIAELTRQAKAEAMANVMPGCTPDDNTTEVNGCIVIPMRKNGVVAGYCVEVAPNGFGGAINMIVGVELASQSVAKVTGISIVSMSETAGIGTKTNTPDFLDQYTGLNQGIGIGSGENSISAISGATVSSKAVTNGVNMALDAVIQMGGTT